MPDIVIPLWGKILIGLVFLAILASIIYAARKIGGVRTLGVVFMSLTALFTLMGGAGTTCVAINPTGYDGKFAGIAPYQWLWVLFVLIGIAAGVMGVRAVVMLIKGTKHAYRDTIIALLVGTGINLIHMFASRALRDGSSMPVDGVLYMNVLTLVLFLIFRIPGIYKRVDFDNPPKNAIGKQAAAIALGACGVLSLTIQYLMAPTHTIGGINYADVWHVSLTLLGVTLILVGIATALYTEAVARRVPVEASE